MQPSVEQLQLGVPPAKDRSTRPIRTQVLIQECLDLANKPGCRRRPGQLDDNVVSGPYLLQDDRPRAWVARP
jgi:hypothetical protein